tara:strand:- start:20459 stop:23110 length:2652 start_codon:yes stop_codon:yes gene_type:complete
LSAINAEEKARTSAKLRVFLGMSAGVGKTFAMLKAAHQKKNEGVDVVVGIVETHNRSETAALLNDLEIVPRKKIQYRETVLEELDIDTIIRRKPELVVVDELAHTNAPGSRHQKRYQDVLELLDHGIDVLTALNVQHLESRKDAAESITGISIRETVPDSIIERAGQVELVDIAPIELLKRLSEGKVYLGDKAAAAAAGFFKEDKLTALREIALRFTAERVDQDLQKFSAARDQQPWQTNERLLVAVSHSPYSEKIIRATRRIAYSLEAPWIAVHVDTGIQLNSEDQAQLNRNLSLAKELKAEVVTMVDTSLAEALKRICRQKNVTQVIVGRPTRRWFRDLLEGGSLLNHFIKESLEVDIHIIRQDQKSQFRPSVWQELKHYRSATGWIKYWNTLWFLAAITALSTVIEPFIGYRTVGFIFLLGVLTVGLFGSLGAVLMAAAVSALTWNIGFIPPKFTITISQPEDFILCIAYFVVAIITGFLTNRIRFHEKVIRDREDRTNMLFQILQDISNAKDKREFIEKTVSRVDKTFDADCGIILKSKKGNLDVESNKHMPWKLDDKEQAVAIWCFQNRKSAGWSTDTLSQSRSLYIPLRGANEVVGVFVFKPNRKIKKMGSEHSTLLFAIVGQLGISIERHFLGRRLQEAQRLKDSEVLHQTLLNSISHELRTPLTAMLGATAALDSDLIQDPYVKDIARSLNDTGTRLNQVIENLLDMSRLSSGVLALNLEWHDPSDLVGVVLKRIKTSTANHVIVVEVPADLAMIKIDFRLFEHAISNLILNATQYTPKGSKILIKAHRHNSVLKILVEDNGPGIPELSVPYIFEKFYRVPGAPPGGTGLGLSIVKEIVNLHHGELGFEANSPHGARFVISLPIEEQPTMPAEEE